MNPPMPPCPPTPGDEPPSGRRLQLVIALIQLFAALLNLLRGIAWWH